MENFKIITPTNNYLSINSRHMKPHHIDVFEDTGAFHTSGYDFGGSNIYFLTDFESQLETYNEDLDIVTDYIDKTSQSIDAKQEVEKKIHYLTNLINFMKTNNANKVEVIMD